MTSFLLFQTAVWHPLGGYPGVIRCPPPRGIWVKLGEISPLAYGILEVFGMEKNPVPLCPGKPFLKIIECGSCVKRKWDITPNPAPPPRALTSWPEAGEGGAASDGVDSAEDAGAVPHAWGLDSLTTR